MTRFGNFQSTVEHGAVAAVDAVEIADGNHAAFQPFGQADQIIEAENARHLNHTSQGMTATGATPWPFSQAASRSLSGLPWTPYSLA